MGEKDEKRKADIAKIAKKEYKRTKNPIWILLLLVIYALGVATKILPLNVISILMCLGVILFILFCILCGDKIVMCFEMWCKKEMYKEKQKTERYKYKQSGKKRKRGGREEEEDSKQEEETKEEDIGTNYAEEESSCKIYDIKRSRYTS